MLDPAIQEFLDDREKKGKSHTLDEFLPIAAKDAWRISFVTHPPKYSHPNAKDLTVIAIGEELVGPDDLLCESPRIKPGFLIARATDGYLRTGNVNVKLDAVVNAKYIPVFNFLSLILKDKKTVLQHLEENSEYIQNQLANSSIPFDELSREFLKIKQKNSDNTKTHGGIKQVYFPVNKEDSEYHLLSVLTPSGILYELKSRINALRFSDQAKESREARKGNKAANDYSEIYGLTSIGFGGTKPQNISVLNNQNGGVAYLLSSLPPVLDDRRLNPPRSNFFDTSYTSPNQYKEQFENFHKTLMLDVNNIDIRRRIKGLAKSIYFEMIDRSWQVRYLESGWSDSDRYQSLPKHQKLWLDQQYREQRSDNNDWLDNIKESFVRWFIRGYEKVLDKQALKLSDYEFLELKSWLDEIEEGIK